MLSVKQENRIRKYKILRFGKNRARQIIALLDTLSETGRLNFENARKSGISYEEWLASVCFFTSSVGKCLPDLREYLKNDILD